MNGLIKPTNRVAACDQVTGKCQLSLLPTNVRKIISGLKGTPSNVPVATISVIISKGDGQSNNRRFLTESLIKSFQQISLNGDREDCVFRDIRGSNAIYMWPTLFLIPTAKGQQQAVCIFFAEEGSVFLDSFVALASSNLVLSDLQHEKDLMGYLEIVKLGSPSNEIQVYSADQVDDGRHQGSLIKSVDNLKEILNKTGVKSLKNCKGDMVTLANFGEHLKSLADELTKSQQFLQRLKDNCFVMTPATNPKGKTKFQLQFPLGSNKGKDSRKSEPAPSPANNKPIPTVPMVKAKEPAAKDKSTNLKRKDEPAKTDKPAPSKIDKPAPAKTDKPAPAKKEPASVPVKETNKQSGMDKPPPRSSTSIRAIKDQLFASLLRTHKPPPAPSSKDSKPAADKAKPGIQAPEKTDKPAVDISIKSAQPGKTEKRPSGSGRKKEIGKTGSSGYVGKAEIAIKPANPSPKNKTIRPSKQAEGGEPNVIIIEKAAQSSRSSIQPTTSTTFQKQTISKVPSLPPGQRKITSKSDHSQNKDTPKTQLTTRQSKVERPASHSLATKPTAPQPSKLEKPKPHSIGHQPEKEQSTDEVNNNRRTEDMEGALLEWMETKYLMSKSGEEIKSEGYSKELIPLLSSFVSDLHNIFDNFVCFEGEMDREQLGRLYTIACKNAVASLKGQANLLQYATLLTNLCLKMRSLVLSHNNRIIRLEYKLANIVMERVMQSYKARLFSYYNISTAGGSINLKAVHNSLLLYSKGMLAKSLGSGDRFSHIIALSTDKLHIQMTAYFKQLQQKS